MPQTLQLNGSPRPRSTAGLPMRRVLVVANQTATSPALIAELHRCSTRGPADLHLVVPALNSRLSHWLSATDEAVSAAHRRADRARAVLMTHGLAVSVEVGDSVPLLAIEDALAEFDADEIVISTLSPGQSHWLEHDVVELARDRFDVPVRHVVGSEDAIGPGPEVGEHLHSAA
jgi:GABA permease